MNVRNSYIAVIITVAVLGGAACKSRNAADEQKKVDDLQVQLDDAQQQLALKEEEAKTKAAAELSAAEAKAADANARADAATTASAKTREMVTAQQARTAAERRAEDKAKGSELADRQRGADDRQSQANDKVQRQIDDLKPLEYTIPAGTLIPVRTTTELSTSRVADGSAFTAVLERDLRVDGTLLAAQGAQVAGVVVSSDRGGRVKGLASLEVTIRSIAGRKDHTIPVKTDHYSVVAGKSTARDVTRTGVMTGAGAVVGAIAGGGKGAAIGAGAGAATGVGTTMATRGRAAVIPAETLMEFKLASPSTVVYQR